MHNSRRAGDGHTLRINNYTRIVMIAAVAALLLLSACSSHRPSHSGTGVYHLVKPGQTLYRIALTYGVSQAAIARANGISDPTKIEAGSKLFIPGARKTLEVAIVRPGNVEYSFLPVQGKITSYFGVSRGSYQHTGIDIAASPGTAVRAAVKGLVMFTGSMNGYGKTIKIDHGNGYSSLYAHLNEINVNVGDYIDRSQIIGTVGNSGNARGYHLHFEILYYNRPMDPLKYLSR